MKEAYGIYLLGNYGEFVRRYICCVKCSKEEISKIVERLNNSNNMFDGRGTAILGSGSFYTYSLLYMCDSADDFYKYMEERKQRELEELATKRAWEL